MKFIINLLFFLAAVHFKTVLSAPNLKVNTAKGHKPISPYIYGINWASDTAFAKEIRLPLNRWGGNAVTRYNWKIDVSNHASDWFFENIAEEGNLHPENLPNSSHSDRFVESDRTIGAKSMITIPLIGWTPKDREKRCGFSVKKYGKQQKTDQWMPDCGNGIDTNGKNIVGNDPHDTSIEITPEFAKEWVQHFIKRFNTASKGGVLFYELDNEYDLWHQTHRDVHPKPANTEEIVNASQKYAAAIKEADPSAQILGPVGWGYLSLLRSGAGEDDRKAHGNVPFGEWYLKQMKEYQDKHGVRLLDYFDNHIYPQATKVSLSDATDATVNAARLRSTRCLWDPSYVDESWIKDLGNPDDKIWFIPRMQKMVADNYPGTKTAITEYNWGAMKDINGALAQADVLGIFGREGLDLAVLWGFEKPTDPSAYAFRMYRNYDGKGSGFGDTSVSAMSDDQDKLAIYASTRSSDHALLLMIINKDPAHNFTSEVSIEGFSTASSAHMYRYSAEKLTQIVSLPNQNISNKGFTATFPSYSITLVVIPPK
jgi:hypothetical protein